MTHEEAEIARLRGALERARTALAIIEESRILWGSPKERLRAALREIDAALRGAGE